MFTINALVSHIRRIASESPEYKYNPNHLNAAQCSYTLNVDGSPGGCIVGRAFRAMGVSEEELALKGGVRSLLRKMGLHDVDGWNDEYSLQWVSNVQNLQDTGNTWGGAIRIADLHNTDTV